MPLQRPSPRHRYTNRQLILLVGAIVIGLVVGAIIGGAMDGVMTGTIVGALLMVIPSVRNRPHETP